MRAGKRHHRFEAGFTVSAQGLFYIMLMWLSFGFIYDIGNAIYASARLRSAVIAGAQDGAKLIDIRSFADDQRLVFLPSAKMHAITMTRLHAGHLNPDVVADSLVNTNNYLFLVVEARAQVPMPILGVFGVPPLDLSARAQAEAISGSNTQHE